ncbi:dj-1 family protein [Colletotrichum truncatum]|uniref:Dj-1 family protein n=1 Tax=Colletotrichum truncatum TaxID=5467 RepID=A0ACC3YJZ5_COLTU|nr:dj-1 family protein [Colletotrichum truncatum]KAF6797464.1 dj-1 family protein [Colletotrichum truncatum]
MDLGMPTEDYGYGFGPSTVATHTFADAPALDVIFVPGGMGNIALEQANNTEIESFLVRRYPQAEYVLSVCTGAVVLARAGLLSGKRATTNKGLWAWVTNPRHGANITWVPSARWIEDGNIWTSSGVAAGIDMTYAFLKHFYGTEILDSVMNAIEYAPYQDSHWDPFSLIHEVPGANTSAGSGCALPVGNGSGTTGSGGHH